MRRTLCATVLALAPFTAVQAQTVGLEEITVTARKVEENLMNVPLAIAAVTAADIEAAGVKDVSQLSAYTPGLFAEYGVNGPGSDRRQLTFRGLSVTSGLVFIDGAPYAGTGSPSVGSVERIEVLVGPQSAYFGRSTFSGAVNYVTKTPGDKFRGQVNAEFAKFDTTDDSISLEGPIVGDKLSARATFHHYSTGGMWNNYSNPSERQGKRREDSFMGTLYAKPTDNLSIKLLLGYQDEETDGMSRNITLYGNDRQPGAIQSMFCNLGGSFGPYWCGALPTADQVDPRIISFNNEITPQMANIFFNNPLNIPTLFDRRFKDTIGSRAVTQIGHLNIDYALPSGWDIASHTALHKTQVGNIAPQFFRDNRYTVNPNFGRVANVLPYLGTYLMQQNYVYDGSQELRITSPQDARLRGTLGGIWFYTRTPGTSSGGFQPASVGVVNPMARASASTPAIFGGLYYDISDVLTLSAEARYQWDNIKSQNVAPLPVGPLSQAQFTSFSPRITIDYKYAPNSLVYALWSRGYRPGGFNPNLIGQEAFVLNQLAVLGATENFLQEKLDNYEIGWKATWAGNRVRTRFAGYYDLWRNGQVSQSLNVNRSNGGVLVAMVTTNVGGVDLYGVEAEGEAQITDKLNLKVNFNWAASKIKNYVSAISIRINGSDQVNGKSFPKAPVLAWAVTPTYTDHLSGDWDWFARLDWRHRGKYYADVTNVAWIGAANYLDLHLGVKNENLTLEIYGTNLNEDKHFLTAQQGNDSLCCAAATNVNGMQLYLPDKRSFGVKASYKF